MKNNFLNKAFIFYFLVSLILLDFGNGLKKISYNSFFNDFHNPIFSISHTANTGSAFGLFANSSLSLAIFGIFVLIFITVYVYKNNITSKLELLSVTLFTAGTLGNLIERLRFGYVTDYINLNFINFPVFNSFDIMISLGVFLYLIFVLFDMGKENGKSNQSK